MDEKRMFIVRKLIGEQLVDLCKRRAEIIFDPALCTQERCIRFTTPPLEKIIPASGLMYELHNGLDEFCISAAIRSKGLTKSRENTCLKLAKSCGADFDMSRDVCFIRQWKYPDSALNFEKIAAAAEDFFEFELPFFEGELEKWYNDHDYRIRSFPELELIPMEKNGLPDELFIEGAMKDILTNRYERNFAARKKCIAVHGAACSICGFDFGLVYGSEFAGKIEVHHKLPLNEIKENYTVDPVNDLIPVCPNCHMMLHSKPDGGVYTPEEIRALLKNKTVK